MRHAWAMQALDVSLQPAAEFHSAFFFQCYPSNIQILIGIYRSINIGGLVLIHRKQQAAQKTLPRKRLEREAAQLNAEGMEQGEK
jgi:hypothetical protein